MFSFISSNNNTDRELVLLGDIWTSRIMFTTLSLSLSLSFSLLVSLRIAWIMMYILTNILHSLVAAASNAPQGTHTQSHTVGNAVSAIFRDKKKEKTENCSFLLELSSVDASLVKKKTTKQNKQRKIDQLTRQWRHKNGDRATAQSPAGPILPFSYSNPGDANHLLVRWAYARNLEKRKKKIKEDGFVSRRTSLARPLKFVYGGYFIYKKDAKIVEVSQAESMLLWNSMIVTLIPLFTCFQRDLSHNVIKSVANFAFARLINLTTL